MIRTLLVGIGLVSIMGLSTAVAQPGRDGAFGREGHGPRGPGPGCKTLDADSDGFVSLAEFLAPDQEHFAELDLDGDGAVAFVEFIERPEEQFGELDTDGSGALTSDELRSPKPKGTIGEGSGHRPPHKGMGRGGHRNPMLDTDSNGLVSLAEFVAPAEEHFARLDTDGDGLVSLAEFVARAETRFSELDANDDGQLSEDEFHAHGQPPRGMRGGIRRSEGTEAP